MSLRFILLLFFGVAVLACCRQAQKPEAGAAQDPSTVVSEPADSTAVEKPEGFKSPHQEHSEKHKDEPSKIN